MRISVALTMYARQTRPLVRPATWRNRRQVLQDFRRVTGDMELKAIKPKHINAYLAARDVSAATIRQRLSVLHTFFQWAVQANLAKVDPTVGIRAPRQPKAAPRALALPQLRDLGSALPSPRARLIVALMLNEGLRAGEVARLEMADVDLFSNAMRVMGKGGHERLLPLTDATRSYLDAYLRERGRGGGSLIRSERDPNLGVTPGRISTLVAQWMTEAGVKERAWDGTSAHALRHTMAENLYRHGVDLRTIAAAMGHASPTTTWIYLRHQAGVEDLRQVMGQQIIDEERPSLRPVPEFITPPEQGMLG